MRIYYDLTSDAAGGFKWGSYKLATSLTELFDQDTFVVPTKPSQPATKAKATAPETGYARMLAKYGLERGRRRRR